MEGIYQNTETLLYREKTSKIEMWSLKAWFFIKWSEIRINMILHRQKKPQNNLARAGRQWSLSQTLPPLAIATCHHVPRAGWPQS